MKSIPNRSIERHFIFFVLALCVSTGILCAQGSPNDYAGKFTLPFEAKWGEASLPPGDYTFKLDTAVSPYIITVRSGNRASVIMPQAVTDRDASSEDCLIVVRRGKTGTVRALRLATPKPGKPNAVLVFLYAVPRSHQQLLAQGPELIQRIPIVAAGK